MAIDNGCSEPGVYNPKLDRNKHPKSGMFKVFNSLANPIPAETVDAKSLSEVWKKWNLVPFAGSHNETGHGLLAFYELLYKLSPTNGSCINKKAAFAFGSKPTAGLALDYDFDIGEELEDIAPAAKAKYRDALMETVIFDRPIREFHRLLAVHYQKNGNAWIKMKYATVNGITKVYLSVIPQANVLYFNLPTNTPKYVAISPVWTEDYLKENPPEVVPVFPTANKSVGGSFVTMFHLKAGENEWYGRPVSENSDYSKYSEVQNSFYRIRSAYGDFTGKLILEAEANDPKALMDSSDTDARESGYSDEQQRFEENFTQRGDDPQSVYVTYRPYGSSPLFVYSVPPNTSQEYYKVIKGMDQDDIVRSHGCTLRFMAFDVAGGFSSNVFLDDYMLYVRPVIEDLRTTILSFVNKALTVAWELSGKNEFNAYSLAFTSPVENDLVEYKDRQNQPLMLQAEPDDKNNDPGNKPDDSGTKKGE